MGIVFALLESVKETAIKEGLNILSTIVKKESIISLFKELGFQEA